MRCQALYPVARTTLAIFIMGLLATSAWGTEKVLYSFGHGEDGAQPSASLIADSAGNLYGTTAYGGAYSMGAVYEFHP